jgi:hypothetical protein
MDLKMDTVNRYILRLELRLQAISVMEYSRRQSRLNPFHKYEVSIRYGHIQDKKMWGLKD